MGTLPCLSSIFLQRETTFVTPSLLPWIHVCLPFFGGWSGGAKVLGKLTVPGHPTSFDDSWARAYCACSRCGWGVVWTFFSLIYLSLFLSPSLWETARYRLKYCLKGPLNPKQPTNLPFFYKGKQLL